MTITLAKRLAKIQPSATMAVNALANEMLVAGINIINLSVGEPDFTTPDFVNEAAIKAINDGLTRYTAADGIAPLKDAIINKFKKDNQLTFTDNQVIVSNGAKQALYNLTQVLLNEGDEAIILTPYWVSYPEMVKLAEATPVIIETTSAARFKVSPAQLEAAITPKTRLLFFNSPSNPSGMAYTATELKALGKIIAKHPQIIIATDDIYEYILWGENQFVTLLNVCPELAQQTIVVNGVSKAYAMTGWRIGYAAGPAEIIAAMKKIQSQSTTCASSISQYAAVAALNHDRSFFTPMLTAYKRRHDLVYAGLKNMRGVEALKSDGTFYLFPKVEEAIAHLGVKDDIELAKLLLEKAHVAIVPGTAFGSPNYIRISCATSDQNLELAIERLTTVFNKK